MNLIPLYVKHFLKIVTVYSQVRTNQRHLLLAGYVSPDASARNEVSRGSFEAHGGERSRLQLIQLLCPDEDMREKCSASLPSSSTQLCVCLQHHHHQISFVIIVHMAAAEVSSMFLRDIVGYGN